MRKGENMKKHKKKGLTIDAKELRHIIDCWRHNYSNPELCTANIGCNTKPFCEVLEEVKKILHETP